jgi:transposase
MMCWLSELAKIYADSGRPSIPPERLLRALLLQAFHNVAAPCKPLAWCSGKKVP